MADLPTGFLVQRRDDGFGDVHPLQPGQRYTIGRAPDNRIVLRDDLCSRHHAEIFADLSNWVIRDLSSLNGMAINATVTKGDATLKPHDELRLGRANFLYVQHLDQLPELPSEGARKSDAAEGIDAFLQKRAPRWTGR